MTGPHAALARKLAVLSICILAIAVIAGGAGFVLGSMFYVGQSMPPEWAVP